MLEYQNEKYTYTLNSNAAVEALEFFFEQFRSDINAPWRGDSQSSRIDPFKEGRVGMIVAEWWYVPTYFMEMQDDWG